MPRFSARLTDPLANPDGAEPALCTNDRLHFRTLLII
jgi:hypothetical protein